MGSLKKILSFICCISLLLAAVATAAPDVRFQGYLMHVLTSSPHYFRPGNDDWAWELWNGGRGSLGGSEFMSTTPPAFGGMRFRLNTTVGNPNSPFYLYLPLLAYGTVDYDPQVALLSISSGSSTTGEYVMQTKGSWGAVSLTSQNMRARAPWFFSDMGDPLGAMKLINTAEPTMTFKYTGELPFGFSAVGYHISDNRTNFIPSVEKISSEAYTALGETPQKMKFYDEIPAYTLARLTRKLGQDFTLGILWGQKQAVNINPRNSDEQKAAPKAPTHGIGYNKTNVGFDLEGSLPFKNEPKLTLAAVASQGVWQQYKKGINGFPTVLDLGQIQGNAYKAEIKDLALGKTSFTGSYRQVSPQFQWIAVRNSRYAYTKHYNSPSDPSAYYYGWRPVLDDDFLLRNPNEKDAYLSDISSYFGLEVSQLKLEIPGKVGIGERRLPTNLVIGTNIVDNLGEDSYFDPIAWQEKEHGYLEYKAALEMGKQNSKATLFAGEQLYNQDFPLNFRQNIRQELGIEYEGKLTEYLGFTSQLHKLWRVKEADGLDWGSANKLSFALSGETDNGTELETRLNYRSGTYTDDLSGMVDYIVGDAYTDLTLGQYTELENYFSLGSLGIEAKIATEAIYRTSSLPDLSGFSLVGYLEGQTRITRNLTATIVGVGVTGPKKAGFSSNSLGSTMNYQLLYRPFGSRDNSLNLDLTKRFTLDGMKTNWYLRWNTRKGRHSVYFTYGYRPTNENRYMIAGAPWEARYSMPAKEHYGRPWYSWRDQAIYSDETYENFLSVSWSFYF